MAILSYRQHFALLQHAAPRSRQSQPPDTDTPNSTILSLPDTGPGFGFCLIPKISWLENLNCLLGREKSLASSGGGKAAINGAGAQEGEGGAGIGLISEC